MDEDLPRPTSNPTQDGRTRWSEEDNIILMRVHYIAKDMEMRTTKRYRQLLTEIWNDVYPSRQSYANLLSNRVRWILENKKFTTEELYCIERSYNPTGATEWVDDPELIINERTTRRVSLWRPQNPIDLETNTAFKKNLMLYGGIAPEKRPNIPRMKGSKEMLMKVESVDRVLAGHIGCSQPSLHELVDFVYVGAVTVCESLGRKITYGKAIRIPQRPPWTRRLEEKIKKLRKKIGIFHSYLNTTNPSKRLRKSIKKAAAEYRIKTKDKHFVEQITVLMDKLKQKIKALGNRLRRYNERVSRYQNNQLFYKNQRQFYRNLEVGPNAQSESPKPDEMHGYWNNIWADDEPHSDGFVTESIRSNTPEYSMQPIRVSEQDLSYVLKKLSNWSAPGVDKIHNYWWKHFSSLKPALRSALQEALDDPAKIPEFFTLGVTNMLPKENGAQDPKKYRPITCLPTIYKILTGTITRHLWKHVNANNILAKEQNGCRRNAMGCKELLVIDSIITKQASRKLRNLSMAWIDYKKAFDSVPHSWLLEVLKLYGVSVQVVNLLEHLMQTWRTNLIVKTTEGEYKTAEIKIKRGIFQGDTLSPLWFCLALNPLSQMLNNNKYGYILNKVRSVRISHSLYMDDLKLYARNAEELKKLLSIVKSFSRAIRMEMGVEKCAVIHVKRGKIVEDEINILTGEEELPHLGPQESYKYLGIQQALEIRSKDVKSSLKEKLLKRLRLVLKAKLNSGALFSAINSWVLPSVVYSFGVIGWSRTEIDELSTKIRTTLTKFGVHHPHASVNRLYIPRKEGGRGMQHLSIAYDRVVSSLREYFLNNNNSPFKKTICEADENITPLHLSSATAPLLGVTVEKLREEWYSKPLHGRYPKNLKSKSVNEKESTTYLTSGYLFPETEGRILAVQDQVVGTRAFLKRIAGQNLPTDLCRRCNQATEHIQHITSSCPILAPREYLERHNAVCKIYHQAIGRSIGLIKDIVQNHTYLPSEVLENDRYKLCWDTSIITDRPVQHNRPDIVLLDREKSEVKIIDVTIPADDNMERAYTDKLTKYHDLAFEMKEIYRLKTTSVIPLILSVNGLVESHLLENTLRLGIEEKLVSLAQKEVILGTARTVRKFLTSM